MPFNWRTFFGNERRSMITVLCIGLVICVIAPDAVAHAIGGDCKPNYKGAGGINSGNRYDNSGALVFPQEKELKGRIRGNSVSPK